jgi:hypothetical protein
VSLLEFIGAFALGFLMCFVLAWYLGARNDDQQPPRPPPPAPPAPDLPSRDEVDAWHIEQGYP